MPAAVKRAVALAALVAGAAFAADPRPAAYAVSVNAVPTESHAAHSPRQPASLAKLAAALVILERFPADSPAFRDAVVEVSARAARETGVLMGLREGDRAPFPELFAAMLVASANDACAALVDHASHGKPGAFVADMNRLAARLGMNETRFVDPCGHDRDGQRTTAADLLALAHAALAQDEILRYSARKSVRVAPLGSGRPLGHRNTNFLIGQFNGVFGLKTGYTPRAGGCVIAAARLGSTTVVVVVLGSGDRWRHAAELLDRAFEASLEMPRSNTPGTRGLPER